MNKKIDKKYIVGIDVGGSSCKIALFTINMKMIKKWKIDTDTKNNGNNILKKCAVSILLELSKKNIDKREIYGVGVALPGPCKNDEVILKAVNLSWKKPRNIKNEIERYFYKGLKVKISNDAKAAAFGEYKIANDKKLKTFIMLTLGTAIGGGLIYDGKIVNGRNGFAMETSHIKINFTKNARRCNCGNYGCVETECGINSIVKSFKENLCDKKLLNLSSVTRKFNKSEIDKMSTKEICDLAKKGDKLCTYTIRNAMWNIGYLLSIVVVLFDPDMIVLGGGVSNAGNIIIKYIKEGLKENQKMVKDLPPIKISKLKNDAGVYGAGYLVKDLNI